MTRRFPLQITSLRCLQPTPSPSMHSLSMTDIVLRLLTALACGAVIGLNR
jgi:hypothetical protein